MKDIIEILERWTGAGASVALGSVVERVGSAPRDPGAALAVSSNREIAGGVTGGCVEPAVIRQHGDLHTFRVCCRIVRGFALTDAEAFAVLREWNRRCDPPWPEPQLASQPPEPERRLSTIRIQARA